MCLVNIDLSYLVSVFKHHVQLWDFSMAFDPQ